MDGGKGEAELCVLLQSSVRVEMRRAGMAHGDEERRIAELAKKKANTRGALSQSGEAHRGTRRVQPNEKKKYSLSKSTAR